MSSIEQLLHSAFPDTPELASSAVKEILHLLEKSRPGVSEIATATATEILARTTLGTPSGISPEEHQDALDTVAMYRNEIERLNTENARHKDGVQNATKAGLDVLGERARQRRLEGYDDAHDDGRDDFSLSAAAIAYIMDARLRASTGKGFDVEPPVEWPWAEGDWKPKQVRKSLVVATALLLAELERLDRSGDVRT